MNPGIPQRLAHALYKELLRFWKVSFQTILAPVLSALLYSADLLACAGVARLGIRRAGCLHCFPDPGLVMMAVLQNAFANSSSSLIQSKITGNLIFVLLPPLSPLDLYAAYVLGAMVRGLVVGAGVFVVTVAFAPSTMLHPLWALAFALLGSAILGTLGTDRGNLCRQVRATRGVPEFPDHAPYLPVGRVLLDPQPAAILERPVAFQSLLLYDRRVSLRLLRSFRYRAGRQASLSSARSVSA